jgi:hypothetical protein
MNRRNFLLRAGLILSASAAATHVPQPWALAQVTIPSEFGSWDDVRAQFALTRERIHIAGFLLFMISTPAWSVFSGIHNQRREARI